MRMQETETCECGANAVRMRCECGANAVRMRCECGANAVRMRCECGANAVRMRCECGANAVRMRCECGANAGVLGFDVLRMQGAKRRQRRRRIRGQIAPPSLHQTGRTKKKKSDPAHPQSASRTRSVRRLAARYTLSHKASAL